MRHLVIQLARFGDLLQTKRLLASLCAEPGSEVHVCVDRSLEALARMAYPGVTVHGVAAHAGREARENGPGRLLGENRAVFDALAGCGFDLVYNLNFSGLNFALSSLFDETRVRGYKLVAGQALRDQWTTLAFRWTRERRSSPLNLADFWAGLSPRPVAPELVNPVPSAKGGGLGVVLAGRDSKRSLPPEVLAACVRAAREAVGATRVYLLGSAAERPLASAFKQAADRRLLGDLTDLTGKTGWDELFARVAELDAVLTPDTGTMHLAAHLGAPVQAFFLASAWAHETGPYGAGQRVWQAVTDCAPCLESQACPCGLECLEAFKRPKFLRALAGDIPADGLDGLLLLEASFDALGLRFESRLGLDPWAGRRAEARGLAAEYLGLSGQATGPGLARAAEVLFMERDWMALPGTARSVLDESAVRLESVAAFTRPNG